MLNQYLTSLYILSHEIDKHTNMWNKEPHEQALVHDNRQLHKHSEQIENVVLAQFLQVIEGISLDESQSRCHIL